MQKTINYYGSLVVVSEEVAQFLEEDRKRIQNEERSDRRHLDFIIPDMLDVLDPNIEFRNPTLNAVIRKETEKRLKNVVRLLDYEARLLIELRYIKGYSLTKIAELFGLQTHFKCPYI